MKKTFKGKDFTAIFTDENGYFSFTGNFDGGFGACGHRIAEKHPEFAQLEAMHLADAKTGAPLHAWANIDYFFEQGNVDAFNAAIRHDEEAAEYWKHMELKSNASRIDWPTMEQWKEKRDELRADIATLWLEDVDNVLEAVEDIPANFSGGYISPYDEAGDLLPDYEDIDIDELPRREALGKHLDADILDIEVSRYDDNVLEYGGSDYLVVTDDEADELWEQYLDSYLEECVYPELPENMQNYFDDDAWKRDARMDGRGHSLNRYDGCEYDETSDGTGETYYIYRQ